MSKGTGYGQPPQPVALDATRVNEVEVEMRKKDSGKKARGEAGQRLYSEERVAVLGRL